MKSRWWDGILAQINQHKSTTTPPTHLFGYLLCPVLCTWTYFPISEPKIHSYSHLHIHKPFGFAAELGSFPSPSSQFNAHGLAYVNLNMQSGFRVHKRIIKSCFSTRPNRRDFDCLFDLDKIWYQTKLHGLLENQAFYINVSRVSICFIAFRHCLCTHLATVD